jgi:hypothetical protein
LQRPQWRFRHGIPRYIYRWRTKTWVVDLHYHTLDVDPDDVDNFFKVIGRPLEDPVHRETISYGEYKRRHRVEVAKARRIAAIAAHVDKYLQLKAWRTRLRHAISDLEWNFEPYRKHIKQIKKQQQEAAQQHQLDAQQHQLAASLSPSPPVDPNVFAMRSGSGERFIIGGHDCRAGSVTAMVMFADQPGTALCVICGYMRAMTDAEQMMVHAIQRPADACPRCGWHLRPDPDNAAAVFCGRCGWLQPFIAESRPSANH